MNFNQSGSIRYLTSGSLTDMGVIHGFFTRHGGSSPSPWAALNVGGTVGDDPARVYENRLSTFRALDRHLDSLYDVWQVHSAEVVRVDAPRRNTPHLQADAIITNRPGVSLFMRFADCVPILLHDPSRQAVALVHAGWKGTLLKIAPAAVQAMQSSYGCQPADLQAVIGPSIGPDHYEVGAEVIAGVREVFGQDATGLLHNQNGAVKLDLWAANRLLLEQAGLQNIESSALCTACHVEDWYSHRKESGRTGRFGVLIALQG